MKAAIHCRVSTDDREKEDASFQTQQGYVRKYIHVDVCTVMVASAALSRYFSSKW